jgi:proteasome lid subunit RPN8/RPN11
MLHFKKEHIDAMISHANELYPNECCGIIAGRDGRVDSTVRIRNEIESSVEYSMDNVELKAELDRLDEKGLDLIGIYHSHPTSKACPSGSDIKKAVFEEVDCLIISLLDKGAPEIKNYKIKDGSVYIEELKIY